MKITNYKLIDFLKLNYEKVSEYLVYLELLQPAKEVNHPVNHNIIEVKEVKSLTFGQVNEIRNNLQYPNEDSVIDCVSLVTELTKIEVLELPIIEFYGIYAGIIKNLTDISNMEANALFDDDEEDDDSDILYKSVNASQRLEKFGVLNIINSLAGNDITKWKLIEDMPYMTVFTKLVMDKTRNKIERDVMRLQQQKQKHN